MKMKTKRKKITSSSSSSSSLSQSCDIKPSDLNTAVIRIAVAQICKSIGYDGAQTSALETLTDVVGRYIQSLAKYAAASASSTGRTQCNLLDVIRALEDLHSDTGFHGNSDLNRRLYILSDSSILRDTMKFVYLSHEIPFAKALPRRLQTLEPNSGSFVSESTKWNHVPRWLPDFPKIGGEKPVALGETETETAREKKHFTNESNRGISELPERRKKVRFTIGRNVIEMEPEVDLRRRICKGGKRISCQMESEIESFANASSSGNHDCNHDDSKAKPSSMKKKLQQT